MIIEIILSITAAGILVALCSGAYLLIQDSNLKYKVSKELREKYPDLDRGQIKILTYHKLNDMWRENDDK
mgnify:CR=1 FL=1|jgi:hypothetical protein|tara:strand:+ start:206 stop:415 length:210 start_codon:yes stop_codon:yes gene_type:complete